MVTPRCIITDCSGLCLPKALSAASLSFSVLTHKAQTQAVMLLHSNYSRHVANRTLTSRKCICTDQAPLLLLPPVWTFPLSGLGLYQSPGHDAFITDTRVCYLRRVLPSGSMLPWIASCFAQNYSCNPSTVVVLSQSAVSLSLKHWGRRKSSQGVGISMAAFPTTVTRQSTLSYSLPTGRFP